MIKHISSEELLTFVFKIVSKAISKLTGKSSESVSAILILNGAYVQAGYAIQPSTFSNLLKDTVLSEEDREKLVAEVLRLVPISSLFRKEQIAVTDIQELVDICMRISACFADQKLTTSAYSLVEVAYNIKKLLDEPAYDIAEKMILYADFDDADQCSFALWSFAIEQVTRSVSINGEWSEAFDATEIALTVRVSDSKLQKNLSNQLWKVLDRGSNTPLSPLINLFLVEGDPDIDIDEKKETIKTLASMQTVAVDDSEKTWNTLNLMAIINSQMDVDNVRFEFSRKTLKAALAWHDFTLFHSQLEEAVPFGKSLIADVDRTGKYVLELVHEITHAYSLIGTIGKFRNSLRIVIHTCEMLLLPAGELENTNKASGLDPAAHLNPDSLTLNIAQIQFSAAWKALILEAVWRPWLEGVAMYFEMLCNPAQNKTEILPVYEAIRSLIDLDLQRRSDETDQQYVNRIAEQSVTEFESFFSEALGRFSKSSHTGYTYFPEDRTQKNERDFYLMGYLLVRSIVSRWEMTLGRRLEPIEAGKLLLHATRGDANERMIPVLTTEDGQFFALSRKLFINWLQSLAGLDKDSLTDFMVSVETNERGRHFYWKDGKMYPGSSDSIEANERMVRWVGQLKDQALELLMGMSLPADLISPVNKVTIQDAVKSSATEVSDQMDYYWELQTLLPVGKTMAKLNILKTGTGKIILSPRSYIGVPKNDKDDPKKRQRYSVRMLSLGGGEQEVEGIRKLISKRRLSRVLATRVIDLIGRAENPWKGGISSFVCFFIGKDWHHISMLSQELEVKEEHERFIHLLKDRIFPTLFFTAEISTLSSFDYLSNRLQERMPYGIFPGIPWQFDTALFSREFALECCTIAFDTDGEKFGETLATRSQETISRQMGRYLHETGITGSSSLWKAFQVSGLPGWAELLGDPAAFSGIKPFK